MTLDGSRQQGAGGVGLDSGFAEHLTPTEKDYKAALATGLVAVDTNVLLNLYRYHQGARDDLLRILESLRDRLFIPQQVAVEYWRNRESSIRASTGQLAQLKTEIDGHLQRLLQSVSTFANRVNMREETREQLGSLMKDCLEEVVRRVADDHVESLTLDALDTNSDPVLQRLLTVAEGRVGPPLSAEERDLAIAESERRISEQLPPGYTDAGKSGEARHGDYLIWKQVMVESQRRAMDVVLVTGDVKEDWWRREDGATRGPRLELARELAAFAGTRLFMLRPAGLFTLALEALELVVDEQSLRAAEIVDRLTEQNDSGARYPIEKAPDGRSGGYLETVVEMTSLAEDSPSLDDYLDRFQTSFPSISLRDVARRRLRSLESLGFAEVVNSRVQLTPLGEDFLEERAIEQLQDSFLRRIAGGREIRELADSASLPGLRATLRERPPSGLSPTQALLVLRWLEQLDLV